MLKVAALFPLLATLATAAWKEGYAPADNSPCYVDGQDGTVKGALCVINGLGLGKRLLGGDLLKGLNLGKSDTADRLYRWREGDRCDVGGRYGQIKDTLCVLADVGVNVKRQTHPYGFGWFHPGPFAPGDRCWTGTQEGHIQDSLCVAITITSGSSFNNGWFAQPYYGYGHPFGWYHPGPFVEGDKCFQDGKHGFVRDALCIDLGLDIGLGDSSSKGLGGLGLGSLGLGGLGLGKRWDNSPDYWYEPYFGPEHNFGWFHEGPFSEGDRCWSKGRYGNIANSLCVLAGINIEMKRDLVGGLLGGKHDYRDGDRCFKHNSWGLWRGRDCDITLDLDPILNGRSLFGNGDRCWHEGRWGAWKGNSCDLTATIDAVLDLDTQKRDLFRDDPWLGRGVPCTRDGRRGILRDSICIIANVDLNIKRDEPTGQTEPVFEEPSQEQGSDAPAEEAPLDESTEEFPEEDSSEGAPIDGSTSGWEYDGSYEDYLAQQDEQGIDAAEGDDHGQTEEQYEKRLLSFVPGDNGADHAVGKTVNKLLGDIKTRGLIKGSDADKPSPYGNGAPPKGLAGGLGLDKILKSRELLGMDGFRIDDLVKTFSLEKRKAAMRSRQIGGLGDLGGGSDMLGGLLGGKPKPAYIGGASPQAQTAPISQGPTSGTLLGGLLGDKGHGKGNLLGGLL